MEPCQLVLFCVSKRSEQPSQTARFVWGLKVRSGGGTTYELSSAFSPNATRQPGKRTRASSTPSALDANGCGSPQRSSRGHSGANMHVCWTHHSTESYGQTAQRKHLGFPGRKLMLLQVWIWAIWGKLPRKCQISDSVRCVVYPASLFGRRPRDRDAKDFVQPKAPCLRWRALDVCGLRLGRPSPVLGIVVRLQVGSPWSVPLLIHHVDICMI